MGGVTLNNVLDYHMRFRQKGGTISNPTVIRGCTNPNAINYNQFATEDDGSCILPTNDDYRPDPNYVRKGLVRQLIFNNDTASIYNGNWLSDDRVPASFLSTYAPFYKPGDVYSNAPNQGQAIDPKHEYTSKSDRSTGNTDGRVHHNINITSQSGSFYVQSVKQRGFTHDGSLKRNANKLYSGRFQHIQNLIGSGTNLSYDADQTRQHNHPTYIEDIVRAEWVHPSLGNMVETGKTYATSHREQWLGASLRLPDTGRPVPGAASIPAHVRNSEWYTGTSDSEYGYIIQWHGDDSLNPPQGFAIKGGQLYFIIKWANTDPTSNTITQSDSTNDNRGTIYFHWGTNHIGTIGTQYGNLQSDFAAKLGTPDYFPYGQYVDLIVHNVWDHRKISTYNTVNGVKKGTMTGYGSAWDGLTEVWVVYRDATGKRVLRKWIEHYGPNCYNQSKSPYIKGGVYQRHYLTGGTTTVNGVVKPNWAGQRTVNFDEIRFAVRTDAYAPKLEDVVPSGLDL